MATSAETFLRYELLTGDMEDLGVGSVFESLRDIWWATFQLPAFSSWSDNECIGAAIKAVNSLGNEALVDFWEHHTQPQHGEKFSEWIETHRIPMPEVEEWLERVVPNWWGRNGWPENLDWGWTDTGEALVDRWFKDPPPEVRPSNESSPPWLYTVDEAGRVCYEGHDPSEAERVWKGHPGSTLVHHGPYSRPEWRSRVWKSQRDPEFKICPRCTEEVRRVARECRSCGFRFDRA